ncbi:hypothetical protein SASPL_122029 [Salvia splendens]|uniref:Uncharacterized protein n=1 Tax=Salvia splendens TaxID=180675 RepID=A0A8X8ZS23_SALSN|nr:hypothetical protein SASPL_122029 [Salvia splendens]
MSHDSGLSRVNYEDGDFEDLDSGEVKVIIVEECDLNEKKERLDKLLPIKDMPIPQMIHVRILEIKTDILVPPPELPQSSGHIGVPTSSLNISFSALIRRFRAGIKMHEVLGLDLTGQLNLATVLGPLPNGDESQKWP